MPGSWTTNGTIAPATNSLTSSGNGSIIYNGSALGTSEYEVRVTINLAVSGGDYSAYLRATSTAEIGASTGTFYAVELQNPTFSGGSCSAILALVRRFNGILSTPYSAIVPCHTGPAEPRVVYSNGTKSAFLDRMLYILVGDTNIGSGQPGAGVRSTPAGNSISAIDMAVRYAGAPSPVDPQSITASSFPNRADIKWTGAAETNGPGVAWYQILRGPYGGTQAWLGNLNNNTTYEDTAVTAGTSYTYTLIAYDWHLNSSARTFNVDTAPTGALDPRQIGLKPLAPTGEAWASRSICGRAT